MVKLRKDLKIEVKSPRDAVGYYLHEPVVKKWSETFVDEDTGEKTEIERCEILHSVGTFIGDEILRDLELNDVKEVTVCDVAQRAIEDSYKDSRVYYYQVRLCSTSGNVTLIVRAQSVVLAAQAAADYAESDPISVFGSVCHFFVTEVKCIVGLHFINRTKEDLQKEREVLAKDASAPEKTPFRVKAKYLDMINPNKPTIRKEEYVVWAYDVKDAREIVIAYMRQNYKEFAIVDGRDTLKVTNATPYIKHILVPAFVSNAYISNEKLWLSTANDIVTND